MNWPNSYEYQTAPADSGVWLIEQLTDESHLAQDPLSDWEISALKTDFRKLGDEARPALFVLNNRLVPLARRRMDRFKAHGAPTVKVRRGLRVPVEWNNHYLNVYKYELPWPISLVMQNAMLKNDVNGERKPWKSN